MGKWVKIFSSSDAVRASLVKQLLELNDINTVLLDKTDSSYNNFGEKELYVEREQVLWAIKILQDDIGFD